MIKKITVCFLMFVIICSFKCVYADDNIALNKEAYGSSRYSESAYGVECINDGSTFYIWASGSVKLLGNDGGMHYVAIDLGDKYVLNSVKAVTRRDIDQVSDRVGWVLQVANNRDFSDKVTIAKKLEDGLFGEDWNVTVENNEPYRYVRVASPQSMVVAEIEVYGEKYNPATMKSDTGFTDVEGKNYEGAANVLSSLGILDGVQERVFDGESLFTRAQAAKMIINMKKLSPLETADYSFEDVPPDYWAAPYIYKALEQGIVSTNTKFNPDEYVSTAELDKMILCAMGYDNLLEYYSAYPTGVMQVANNLGIMKGVNTTGNVVSRGQAAIMVYNALLTQEILIAPHSGNAVEYKKSSDAMLKRVFNCEIAEGIMTEDSVSALVKSGLDKEHHISINGVDYDDQDDKTDGMLGNNICVMVDSDDSSVFCAWKKNNEITLVNGKDFISATDGRAQYYEQENKIKSVSLSDSLYLIKNGGALTDFTPDDFECGDGYVEFIDNNKDGRADVAKVWKPQVIINEGLVIEDGGLRIVGKNNVSLSYDNVRYIKLMKNGKRVSPGKIAKSDVIFAYISDDGLSVRLEAVNNSVSGKVKSISEKSVSIDGMEYEFSQYYNAGVEIGESFKLGSPCVALLDINGRICWVVRESTALGGQMKGFVVKAVKLTDTTEQQIQARIYNQDGAFENCIFADKVKFNSKAYSQSDIEALTDNGAAPLKNKFILYKKNADNMIYEILTEESGNTDIVKRSITVDKSLSMTYIANSDGLFEGQWLKIPLKKTTMTFLIPVINGEPVAGDYEKYYAIKKATDAYPTLQQLYETCVKCEFFGENDYGYPSFNVKYQQYGEISSEGLSPIINDNAEGVLVDYIAQSWDDETEEGGVNIYGVDVRTGKKGQWFISGDISSMYEAWKIQREHTDWLKSNYLIDESKVTDKDMYTASISELKCGDIVRFNINGGIGTSLERVYKRGEMSSNPSGCMYTCSQTYPGWPTSSFRLMGGKIKLIRDNYLIFEVTNSSKTGEHTIDWSNISVLYVVEGGKLEQKSSSELPHYGYGTNILFYTTAGLYKTAIIYN